MSMGNTLESDRGNVPPDKLVENVDVLLHVRHLHWLFGVEDRERGWGSTVVEIAATGLEEATDKEDLKESICILEEFELATGCD